MPITYYNPDRPQQRQYEFIMQMLMNLGMQKRQLAARKEEADIANTRMEAREKANRMWLDNREARQRGEEAKIAVRKQRDTMAEKIVTGKQERIEKEELLKKRPGAVFHGGKVYFPQKATKPAAPVKGAKFYWQRDPKDPTKFIKTRVPVPLTKGSGDGTGTDEYKRSQVMDDATAHYGNLIKDMDRIFGTLKQSGDYSIDRYVKLDTPYGKQMTYDQTIAIIRAEEAKAKRDIASDTVPEFLSRQEEVLDARQGYRRHMIRKYLPGERRSVGRY